MKKKVMHMGLGIAACVLVVGMVFCILRPSYVKEAVQILLKNELVIEPAGSSDIPEESTEESEETSSVKE